MKKITGRPNQKTTLWQVNYPCGCYIRTNYLTKSYPHWCDRHMSMLIRHCTNWLDKNNPYYKANKAKLARRSKNANTNT